MTGFSKCLPAAGLCVGYIILNESGKIGGNVLDVDHALRPSTAAQSIIGGLLRCGKEWIISINNELKRNRTIIEGLRRTYKYIEFSEAEGGYVFTISWKCDRSGDDISQQVLERRKVALFSSERFEPVGRFVRVAYGCEHSIFEKKIEEVAGLIEDLCAIESG